MTEVELETPALVQASDAPAPPIPRLAVSASLYSSFNPYATLPTDTTGNSQPSVDSSQEPSQEKDSEKASDEERVGKKAVADDDDEEVFKRPFPVNRSTSAAPGGQSEDGGQKENGGGEDSDEGAGGEGEWFSDLPDPGLPEGMPRPKMKKKPVESAPPPPRSPTSGDEQADEIVGAKALQLSKAQRLIREQYRRPTNQPPLPPSELAPEEVLPSVQQRSKPIFEETKRQLASVGLRGPLPRPSLTVPGLSADSVDDVASASAAEEPSGAQADKNEDDNVEIELIISPPVVSTRRKPAAPLLPPPTTQELEAESERQQVADAGTSQATPGNVVRLHIMPTLPSQDDMPPPKLGNPLAQTTLIPMGSRSSSLSASQLSQTNDLSASAVREAPEEAASALSAAEQAKVLADTNTEDLVKGLTNVAPDDPEVADILAAVGVELPPEIKEKKQMNEKAKERERERERNTGEIESADDFSDDEDAGTSKKRKKKKKTKSKRPRTGDEEVLGDSNDEAPSSEEEGEELVSEEPSEESSEALRPLSSDDEEIEDEDLEPADPQMLYKQQEDEAFTAGIAAMQARLAAKKAEKLAPAQRRKRKEADDDEDEEEAEGEEAAEVANDEIAATLPIPDEEELPSIIRGGSDDEGVVPIKPPAPRDDNKRRRMLTSSSLLDEPDAKEVLSAMRPAGSFRQAPQALRLRKGTSFIADKAQSVAISAIVTTHSSSSSLSASASLSLSHSGFVFGRESAVKAKPAAAAAAPKAAPDTRKRQQRPAGPAPPPPLTKKGNTLLSVLSQNFFDSKDS